MDADFEELQQEALKLEALMKFVKQRSEFYDYVITCIQTRYGHRLLETFDGKGVEELFNLAKEDYFKGIPITEPNVSDFDVSRSYDAENSTLVVVFTRGELELILRMKVWFS